MSHVVNFKLVQGVLHRPWPLDAILQACSNLADFSWTLLLLAFARHAAFLGVQDLAAVHLGDARGKPVALAMLMRPRQKMWRGW